MAGKGRKGMTKGIRTMEEFSAFVGFSRPTVSKYFNDPSSVRPSTREKIEAALKKSGFRPSIFAVNLNRRRSNILGIIIPSQTDPFYMGLTRRIETIARGDGLLAIVLSSDGDPDLEDQAMLTFKSMNVAGAIIAPLGAKSRHRNHADLGASIPVVYVDSPLDEATSFVGTNNRQSIGLIVDYLSRSGEAPCFFRMPDVNSNAASREAAYLDAMTRVGAAPSIVAVTPSDSWDFEKYGFDETKRLLETDGKFPRSTVLCANDRIAFGVIGAAYQMGLRVGHGNASNLRVAGHDDHLLSQYTCPPLTTVAQNADEIGRLAIEMLLERLQDNSKAQPESSRILLNADIKIRGSA